MRRLIALLTVVFITLFLFTGCCSTDNLKPNIPSVPEQAQVDLNRSVALVHDFGPRDTRHGAFCSGTWVAQDTILTAGHCVLGYAEMRHKVAIMKKLEEAGIPPQVFMMMQALGMDTDDLDPNDPQMPDTLRQIVVIARSVPVEPPIGLDMPYIVPSEVKDVGAAPSAFQHSTAIFVDQKADIALLKVHGYVPQHEVAVLADKAPAVGEDVTLVGSIQGNLFSFRRNTVSSYRHSEKDDDMPSITGPFMQLSGALVSFGDSGSGVFNERGQLVGVESFISEAQLSYCIHLDTLRSIFIGQRLLKANLTAPAKDPALDDDNGIPLNLQ